MNSERLEGGFECLQQQQHMAPSSTLPELLEACRDTSGLLADAAMEWTMRA
jgi:hypothetical protein